jgi:hypothetical protein
VNNQKLTNRITKCAGGATANYDHAHKVTGRRKDWSRQGNKKFRDIRDTPDWARRISTRMELGRPPRAV